MSILRHVLNCLVDCFANVLRLSCDCLVIALWTAPQGGMRGLGLERAAASEAHCLGGLQQADHTGRLPVKYDWFILT